MSNAVHLSDELRMGKAGHARKNILVVEDEPSVGEVCQIALTDEGFSVNIATNGDIARDMIEKTRYDFCLSDIRMPIMNGVQLYQWICEKHPELQRQIVFTSGDVMGGDIQGFIEKAARLFLPKPFTPRQLSALFKELAAK